MARFQPKSPQEIAVFQAGFCPDCGARRDSGADRCRLCGLSFEGMPLDVTAPPAPASAPQAAPVIAVAVPQAVVPQAVVPQAIVAAPFASTAPDVDHLERGLSAWPHPVSQASLPDAGWTKTGLGAALRQAFVRMADAALADNPDVLLGRGDGAGHIGRAHPHAGSDAAVVDEPRTLLARGGHAPSSFPARSGTATQAGPPSLGPLTLKSLEWSLDGDAIALSAAATADAVRLPSAGLGLAMMRGPNMVGANAALADAPETLLSFAVRGSHVTAAILEARTSKAAGVDDALGMLASASPPPQSHVPRGKTAPAPVVGVIDAGESTERILRSDVEAAIAAMGDEVTAPDGAPVLPLSAPKPRR